MVIGFGISPQRTFLIGIFRTVRPDIRVKVDISANVKKAKSVNKIVNFRGTLILGCINIEKHFRKKKYPSWVCLLT